MNLSDQSIRESDPLADTEQKPQAGDRFRLSALGAARCPGLASKVGTVINRRPDSSIVTVRFDGNRNSTSLHREYIEPTEA
ncbi:hypothetical protein [Bradyrhizobium sp. AUGA SZCCT0042]|uniref:hypothetical protein n=1 Tax=Bradyrhizobium sp. AUGA SZCCT0042 TaxID=2807651 RepID=UPI001BA927D9|nr:hypothetical protein [Bradyrhizobium sp. AUGA SZCCT0042]MBR1302155.1 hypothetical protein [Bradyrhizobium sp. AUGA SZCCT0042]